MATLFDVALDVLSQSDDFANERLGADVLMKNWNDIIGEMTPAETHIAAQPAAFTAYALAIVQLAARTKSQPKTKPALRASRKDILGFADPEPAAAPTIIADG